MKRPGTERIGKLAVARNVAELRRRVRAWRRAGETVALVPTMGALHAGHLVLVMRARELCDRVVASLFVNPTQFAPNEDFARYPRDESGDAAKLAAARCDLLYAPPLEEMYPQGFSTSVSVGALADGQCGRFRPGHFAGVATVVTKLLQQAQADVACFGEKDWQQLQVIRRVVRDLDIAVRIEGVPIVREADGLALSSRNAYLSPAERRGRGRHAGAASARRSPGSHPRRRLARPHAAHRQRAAAARRLGTVGTQRRVGVERAGARRAMLDDGRRVVARRQRAVLPGLVDVAGRQRGELGQPAPHIAPVWIEFPRLGHRVEDAEERRRIGAAARHPLPIRGIVGGIGIDQRVPEPRLAVLPRQQEMLHQETRDDHAQPVGDPSGMPEPAHGGVDQRIAGPPALPGAERGGVVAPGAVTACQTCRGPISPQRRLGDSSELPWRSARSCSLA